MVLLGGKPLLFWTIETALAVDAIDKIVLSSDSDEYLMHAGLTYPIRAIKRPHEYATDNSLDREWIAHAVKAGRYNPGDFIVLLRPTTPFRDPKIIKDAIQATKSSDMIALRSVHLMPESAWKMAEIGPANIFWPLSFYNCRAPNGLEAPRQQFPPTYRPNGYVDVIKIVDKKKYHGFLEDYLYHPDMTIAFITPRVVEIDSMEDLEYARYKCEQHECLV